jgi:hypothetical protein
VNFLHFLEAQFCICRFLDFVALTRTVFKILPFPATYENGVGFSDLLKMKTNHRSRLSVESDLQCAVSSTNLRGKKLQTVN